MQIYANFMQMQIYSSLCKFMQMARDFPFFNLSLPLPAKVLKNTIKIMISIQPENKSLFIKSGITNV